MLSTHNSRIDHPHSHSLATNRSCIFKLLSATRTFFHKILYGAKYIVISGSHTIDRATSGDITTVRASEQTPLFLCLRLLSAVYREHDVRCYLRFWKSLVLSMSVIYPKPDSTSLQASLSIAVNFLFKKR